MYKAKRESYIAGATKERLAHKEMIDLLDNAKDMLVEANIQLDYLTEKFGGTGTTNSVVSRIEATVSKIENKLK